jgi:hypothetical protein
MTMIIGECIGRLGGNCAYRNKEEAWVLDICTVLTLQCCLNRLGELYRIPMCKIKILSTWKDPQCKDEE